MKTVKFYIPFQSPDPVGFLLGVFAWVFLRISAYFCGFLHGFLTAPDPRRKLSAAAFAKQGFPLKKKLRTRFVEARFGWNADRIWASTPQNRTIGVNLAVFDSVLATVNMLKKSAEIRRNTQKYAEIRRNTQAKTPSKNPKQKPQAKKPQAKTPYRAGFYSQRISINIPSLRDSRGFEVYDIFA